jgi:hypothetical protein
MARQRLYFRLKFIDFILLLLSMKGGKKSNEIIKRNL